MARPKEFDRDEVLGAAIDVFWRNGYEATSMDDLLKAMKISRQSLYDTFGDKRRLYLEALGRYNENNVGNAACCLASSSSPLAALRAVLMLYVDQTDEERALGCMGINAIAEFGHDDEAVSKIREISSKRLDHALRETLAAAKGKGEIDTMLDEATAAQYLAVSLAGIQISAKAGMDREALTKIVQMTIGGLKPR